MGRGERARWNHCDASGGILRMSRREKMGSREAELILGMLESHKKLERAAVDEVGWVALKLSCSYAKAEKKILMAKAWKANLLEEKP